MSGGKKRLAILISGTGTNMTAIIEAAESGVLDAEAAVVISDNPNAKGLARAVKMGYETIACPYAKGLPREENEKAVIKAIKERDIDWIVLAGFMRVLSPSFVKEFRGRIVNIHPALLPAFPGARAIRDAIEAGAEVTGVTIHIVDELVDHGPIIAQREVPILPGDTEETLAMRIHETEHELYPRMLQELINEDV
ncbi:phosphoribosylglycinamide formyltransferase [Synergistales bacterium]|nr:phosphoribosylglycinamide formyltransferase [Synergistales bacterium]